MEYIEVASFKFYILSWFFVTYRCYTNILYIYIYSVGSQFVVQTRKCWVKAQWAQYNKFIESGWKNRAFGGLSNGLSRFQKCPSRKGCVIMDRLYVRRVNLMVKVIFLEVSSSPCYSNSLPIILCLYFRSPSYGGFLTLYSLLQAISIIHLFIIQPCT